MPTPASPLVREPSPELVRTCVGGICRRFFALGLADDFVLELAYVVVRLLPSGYWFQRA